MTVNWTKWALVAVVAGPLVWLVWTGSAGHASAWLITALVALYGVRSVLRSTQDPR